VIFVSVIFVFFNFKEAEGVLVIGEVVSFRFEESVVDSKLGYTLS